jgi:glycosyltransferase involved in cell wall biosynthesis
MRILLDYRPALKTRSGVGEWVHELARALIELGRRRTGSAAPVDLTLFTSSWKDRLSPAAREELLGARVVDRRVPVSWLNLSWNRLGWPAVESLAGRGFDVVLSPHPLLLPARGGLKAMTIHDLDFLDHPERTRAEIRRDYPVLVREHAARADLVVVVSEHTAGQVERRLGVPRERMVLCGSGVPAWALATPPRSNPHREGHLLFVGTLEARKNIKGLLDAYRLLVSRMPDAPKLVIVGRETPESADWKDDARTGTLSGRVEIRGYVSETERREAYLGARMLILPSFHEGFGIPALEAMALGIPVVASNRGALPEVVGDAGLLVDPHDASEIAHAIGRVLDDERLSRDCAVRGLRRARDFTWESSAARLLDRLERDAAACAGSITAGRS